MDGHGDIDHSEPVEGQSSPSAILEDLHRRHGARQPTPDERGSERRTWSVPLLIEVQELMNRSSADRKLEVRTLDISASGFAFDYSQYLAVGTRVRVRFKSLANRPCLEGVIRNCRLIDGSRHRMGVQFEQSGQSGGKKHANAEHVDPA